jgi:hypothetical protein
MFTIPSNVSNEGIDIVAGKASTLIAVKAVICRSLSIFLDEKLI